MSDELKPCPFCGGEASWIASRQLCDGTYYPAACGCRKCGIWRYGESDYGHGGFATKEDIERSMKQAIAAWNTRADDAQVIKNAENYKLADDSGPQVITNAEKYELTDSRERLEADIQAYMHLPFNGWRWKDYNHVIEWLDRQAAITERVSKEAARRFYERAEKLQQQVDNLTAERDELREECDKLKSECKECIARESAELRLLNRKLREKQHVCEMQRDSFLKLEAENAELRRKLNATQ